MQLVPGARLDLDDGSSIEVATHAESVAPGVLACEVIVDGTTMLALLAAPQQEESERERVAECFRRARPREGARLGPTLRGRVRVVESQQVGYRDAAMRRDVDAARCLVFELEPMVRWSRLLTPMTRIRWPWAVVARIGVELAEAMAGENVRRLDPSCVGFDARGAWLLDPAVEALLRIEQGSLETSTAWIGYLAPEQIRRRTSDVTTSPDASARHALGVLLHELVTGDALYTRETPLETLIAVRTGMPPSLSRAVPGISLDLAACIHGLLDHDPLRRPEPAMVARALAPIAAPDLSWTEPLIDRHARPADFLGVTLRNLR